MFMATILVDYENAHGSRGMQGDEYLTEKDHLIVFYSTVCMKIALDFYIATEAGRLSALGTEEMIIVTQDTGS